MQYLAVTTRTGLMAQYSRIVFAQRFTCSKTAAGDLSVRKTESPWHVTAVDHVKVHLPDPVTSAIAAPLSRTRQEVKLRELQAGPVTLSK
jgi:hypothetical protein